MTPTRADLERLTPEQVKLHEQYVVYYGDLSDDISDYRVQSNGTTFRIQHRFWWFFWETVVPVAPSMEWCRDWVRGQTACARVRRAKWKTLEWGRETPADRTPAPRTHEFKMTIDKGDGDGRVA